METGGIQFQIRQPSVRIMGWSCMQCTFSNANDAAANCGACSAIHVLQCPACKGEIKYGKRLHVNGKTYHPDCFCCSGCNKPLQSRFQVVNGGNYHPECAPKPKTIISTTTTTSRSTDARDKSNHSNIKANGSASSHGTGWYCPTCTFFNANDAAPTCGACEAIRIMVCPGCNGEIKYGPRTNVNGQAYHPDCFRCAACHRKFTTSQFQVKDGAYYDQACYKQLFHPRCDVCEDFIPHQPGTQKIAFKIMPFWDLKYCAEHEKRDRCCSCQRIEPIASSRHFHKLRDGRKICHDCCNYMLLDSSEAQGVVKEVWDYMRDIGIHLPEIPVYLVESCVLNAHKKKGTSTHGDNPLQNHVTRGLCLSEVSQIQHMVRSGTHAAPRVTSIDKTRSVNAILILYGLPYDLTASVLAHEVTHAFIKLSNNFPETIPPKIEEGICQLMSYLFLKYKHMMEGTDSNALEARLRKFYMQQIKHDISPIYGDGFREAYAAYKRVNSLQRMFDAIRQHGAFP